eukprot:2559660-Rhodomonas_salina.2
MMQKTIQSVTAQGKTVFRPPSTAIYMSAKQETDRRPQGFSETQDLRWPCLPTFSYLQVKIYLLGRTAAAERTNAVTQNGKSAVQLHSGWSCCAMGGNFRYFPRLCMTL